MSESGPPATEPGVPRGEIDESAGPEEPAQPTPATQPTQATEPAQATQPAQATGPAEPEQAAEPAEPAEPAGEEPPPSWWHSSHPTFAGLVGFFTGVAYVIVVPGIYAALLSLVLSDQTAQRLFPLVGVILVVPLVLLVPRKTRRFAQFMLLGTLATALVIGLTAALVIWVLVQLDG